jgi:hypothetical protein
MANQARPPDHQTTDYRAEESKCCIGRRYQPRQWLTFLALRTVVRGCREAADRVTINLLVSETVFELWGEHPRSTTSPRGCGWLTCSWIVCANAFLPCVRTPPRPSPVSGWLQSSATRAPIQR